MPNNFLFPVLEQDDAQSAIINPWRKGGVLPEKCLLIFFEEVLDAFVHRYDGRVLDVFSSEIKKIPVYELFIDGQRICAMQAMVGAPGCAMQADWLYGKQVNTILCCGGCGALVPLEKGHLILPVKALRDEGTSYHYLSPSRWISLQSELTSALSAILDELGMPYTTCATWTTDGFYRETEKLTALRKEEGCKVVEMECAALAAVAQFRDKRFAQLLYSGDSLAAPNSYDDRSWQQDISAREKLASIALCCLLRL